MEEDEKLDRIEAAKMVIDVATRLLLESMRGDTGTPWRIYPHEAVDIGAVVVGYSLSAATADRLQDVVLNGDLAAPMIEAQLAAITQRLHTQETATSERTARIYAKAFGVS